MTRTAEQTTMRKVYLRLLPFSILCMFVCYLDRVNLGFAALTMNKDLGFSAYLFGLGAGAFYGGYCLFEVPSNLLLEKVGARFWLARIMITWGLFSGAMAFVSGPISFVSLRFLLGAAEAGFFPGILFYFHYWFPARHRGRMISWFTVATPISVALGGPISTALLGLDGTFGLAGWRWVFLVEAAPAVILGFVLLVYLRDRPAHASWLTQEEKDWITSELAHEKRELEAVRRAWKPLLKIALCLLLGFVRRKVLRGGEGMAGRVIKGDPIPGDVNEERPAPRQLVIHIVERVNDKVHRRFQLLGDRQLSDETLRGGFPVLAGLRSAVCIDDNKQVIVGAIAALAILDPAAARVRSEQDDLQDPRTLVLVLLFTFPCCLELVEQDAGDLRQLFLLALGQVIETIYMHQACPKGCS